MLDAKIFSEQIIRLNAILSNNAMIVDDSVLTTYYEACKFVRNGTFVLAIDNLIKKWSNSNFRPTPANILAEVDEIKYCGMSEEEFLIVAKTYKVLGKEPTNKAISNLINKTDEKALNAGKIKFISSPKKIENAKVKMIESSKQ